MKDRMDSIRESMSLLSDEDLVMLLTENSDEYEPIALQIAQEELDSRNIDIDDFLEQKNIENICDDSDTQFDTTEGGSDIAVTELVPFIEVLQKAFYSLVEKNLRLSHPEDEEFLPNYSEFFEKLLQRTPSIHKSVVITLEKEKMYTDGPAVYFWHVYGIDTKAAVKLRLDKCSWNDWLGLQVRVQDLEKIGHEVFVAHCLYEMTKKGFSEDGEMGENDTEAGAVEEGYAKEGEMREDDTEDGVVEEGYAEEGEME